MRQSLIGEVFEAAGDCRKESRNASQTQARRSSSMRRPLPLIAVPGVSAMITLPPFECSAALRPLSFRNSPSSERKR